MTWIEAFGPLAMLALVVTLMPVESDLLASSNSPAAYSRWLAEYGGGYEHEAFLGTNNSVAVHWMIDGGRINLAVAAEGSGWLAFGLAQAGGMAGSDIVSFTAADNSLVDSYAVRNGRPEEDTCQDWELVRSVVSEDDEPSFILFEASRDLITGDTQDHDITDDSDIGTQSHPVIAAWGDSDELSYHLGNTAKGFLRFFAPQEGGPGHSFDEESMEKKDSPETAGDEEETLGSLDLLADYYVIPENETTYAEFCFSTTDLQDRGFRARNGSAYYMIEADFIPDPNTIDYVHHLVLYGSADDDACTSYASFPIYLWAPGQDTFYLPKDVGIQLMGESGGYKSFKMEIHYDNRRLIPDIVDSTGMQIRYTTTPRAHRAGVMVIGDPYVASKGRTVGGGLTRYDFSCPGSCTATHFQQSVTVFYEMLHMHERGRRMVNSQIRDGREVRSGKIDYYDFFHNGAYVARQGTYDMRPGDGFKTSCYYKDTGDRRFGLASRDEMCMALIFYYPFVEEGFHGICGYGVKDLVGDEACDSGGYYENTTLQSEDEMGRTFGVDTGVCLHQREGGIDKRGGIIDGLPPSLNGAELSTSDAVLAPNKEVASVVGIVLAGLVAGFFVSMSF